MRPGYSVRLDHRFDILDAVPEGGVCSWSPDAKTQPSLVGIPQGVAMVRSLRLKRRPEPDVWEDRLSPSCVVTSASFLAAFEASVSIHASSLS